MSDNTQTLRAKGRFVLRVEVGCRTLQWKRLYQTRSDTNAALPVILEGFLSSRKDAMGKKNAAVLAGGSVGPRSPCKGEQMKVALLHPTSLQRDRQRRQNLLGICIKYRETISLHGRHSS